MSTCAYFDLIETETGFLTELVAVRCAVQLHRSFNNVSWLRRFNLIAIETVELIVRLLLFGSQRDGQPHVVRRWRATGFSSSEITLCAKPTAS